MAVRTKRRIVVIGTGRSGTSVVAGVCHKLGCVMGTHFVPTDDNNLSGTYEEINLFQMNRADPPPDEAAYKNYVVQRDLNHGDIWGIKDPGLIGLNAIDRILPHLLPHVQIILAKRDRDASIQSYKRAYGSTLVQAKEWHEALSINLNGFLRTRDQRIPLLEVDFDELLAHPVQQVTRIANYIYAGTVNEYNIAAALEHVCPAQRKFKPGGKWVGKDPKIKRGSWGTVAVSTRIHRHPEPTFFADWTAMLIGGLREGDTVLMPRMHMVAHWASNAIVRDFLRSGRDSLLMTDDDMSFPSDALSVMRDNKANQEYDVVFGFCTMRAWPPRPVILRRMMPPPLPELMVGDKFERVKDIQDGEIIPVDAVGLAFTLIRRHVLEAMIDQDWGPEWTFWFKSMTRQKLFQESYGHMEDPHLDKSLEYTSFFDYGDGKESDDIPFSRRVRELGFRMCVDTSIKIGHIGHVPFGYQDFDAWRKDEILKRRKPHIDFDATELIPSLQAAARVLDGDKRAEVEKLLTVLTGGAA